jgi:hypothetical protein
VLTSIKKIPFRPVNVKIISAVSSPADKFFSLSGQEGGEHDITVFLPLGG